MTPTGTVRSSPASIRPTPTSVRTPTTTSPRTPTAGTVTRSPGTPVLAPRPATGGKESRDRLTLRGEAEAGHSLLLRRHSVVHDVVFHARCIAHGTLRGYVITTSGLEHDGPGSARAHVRRDFRD